MGEERRVAGNQIKGEPGDHGVRVGQGISGGDCGGRCRAGSRRGRWVRQVGPVGQGLSERARRERAVKRFALRGLSGRVAGHAGRGCAGWAVGPRETN